MVKYDKQDQQGKAAFNEPATRANGIEPRRTPNKNRTGHLTVTYFDLFTL
jgi:hypothetical protein